MSVTPTEGSQPEVSAPRSASERVLRSFKTGEIPYGEFLSQLDQLLGAGASAEHLLQILSTDEMVAGLSPQVHAAIVARITSWPQASEKGVARFVEAPTVLLEEMNTRSDAERESSSAAAATQHSPVHVGVILKARFHLVELIGAGGMSRVYKALDLRRVEARSENPYIAVKVLTLPFHEYFGSIAALQSEAHKLQSLAHPNIIRVFDCDRDGEIVFMTMEYLVGRRLLPGPPHDAHAVVIAIARALEYAHRNNIVHGDLKPGNVMVTDRGEVKVIDFGIARWIASPEASPAVHGVDPAEPVAATVARYASPEYASPQVLARHMPEIVDDVYSLGCLAYQLLTGSHPFYGDAARPPKTPPPQRPGLTPTQYAAIVKALQFERADRTATAREFIEQFTGQSAAAGRGKYLVWLAAAAVAVLIAWWAGYRFPKGEVAHPPELVRTPVIASNPAPAPKAAAATPGTVIRDCPTCLLLTVLPSGRFQQGAPATGSDATPIERPQHWVTIGYPLAMSTNDVTVGDFREFATATGRDMQGCDIYDGAWRHRANADWTDPGFPQGATNPVTCVSWDDAVAYAQWLTAKTGHRYRLPSASEWEFAARAGSKDVRPWKPDGADACVDANVADQSAAHRYPGWSVFSCSDGYVYTAPVGSFKANAFGLTDMLGNVFQWTQDCWRDDYMDAPTDGSARADGDCGQREMRGGSWFSSPSYVTASYRNHFAQAYRTSSVGFRLVREIAP